MNKNQTIIIAVFLLIVHLLILAMVVGRDKSKPEPKEQPVPTAPVVAPTPTKIPEFELPEFNIPQLNTPETKPEEKPKGNVPSLPQPKTTETIGVAGTADGYLRKDLPNRRISKVYSSRVNDPYIGAIIVDARTGKIIYQNNATSHAYPASVTKLMTLLLVLEEVENKQVRLSDMIQIPKEACAVGGSQAYLDSREAFSIDDLLNAMVIHSANDAATALAIHLDGSVENFVTRMNEKAKKLGMNATVYHTPHGLPPGNGKQSDMSTAHDVALLSLELLRYSDTLRYTSTELTYLPLSAIRKEEFMLATRNKLIKRVGGYEGCDGLKTGYHKAGGWSVAVTAERNGNRLIVVVLGSESKAIRRKEAEKLLDKGFEIVGA